MDRKRVHSRTGCCRRARTRSKMNMKRNPRTCPEKVADVLCVEPSASFLQVPRRAGDECRICLSQGMR